MRLPRRLKRCREVTPEQWRRPSARNNIARRYMRVKLWLKYGVKPKTWESAVNYSHRVWMKNRRDVPDDEVAAFHKDIVKYIKRVEAGKNHWALLSGTASDALIKQTIDGYTKARSEWGWR